MKISDRRITATAVGKVEKPHAPAAWWPLQPGDPASIGGYQIMGRLGSGGMADVFCARTTTGGQVAVKLLRAIRGAPTTCRREYTLARQVDQHHTAPVISHGMSPFGGYLVTSCLNGYHSGTTPADTLTGTGPLWRFGAQLATILAAVHARGVVHCDVKPSNLMVRGSDLRLIDFGIARFVGEHCPIDGMVQVSRGWGAPEQLRDEPATPAVDVFAWGCVMAYLASGVHPFVDTNRSGSCASNRHNQTSPPYQPPSTT